MHAFICLERENIDSSGLLYKIVNPYVCIHIGGETMRNRLTDIRKSSRVKQGDLATALGVSRQTICAIEKEHWDPSIVLAYKIAKYFGKQIEEVFIFDGI